MEANVAKQLVADTGRVLLGKGLVARTWGNISARVDKNHFAISPSGLGYENMDGSDVPVYDYESETYEGSRKPSSEKKIHAEAYKHFEDVNFVIHTHQDYATVMGLLGTDKLVLTDEEKRILGNVETAGYGLPGTGKLKKNVVKCYEKGSKVVLMIHHGAVILGSSMEDALAKAELLENVCKRTVTNILSKDKNLEPTEELSKEMKASCENLVLVTDSNILNCAERGPVKASLDDIAQMLGHKLRVVENDDAKILKALNKQDAVLVKNLGCLILTEEKDDADALSLLVKKAAMAERCSKLISIKKNLSVFDCELMRVVYKKKYSKKKAG